MLVDVSVGRRVSVLAVEVESGSSLADELEMVDGLQLSDELCVGIGTITETILDGKEVGGAISVEFGGSITLTGQGHLFPC